MSVGNFRGGRKLSPKPSAFESEIYPTHKPSVYAPGISPCREQICAGVNLYSPKKPDCIYPCCRENGRMDGTAVYGYISGQMYSNVLWRFICCGKERASN